MRFVFIVGLHEGNKSSRRRRRERHVDVPRYPAGNERCLHAGIVNDSLSLVPMHPPKAIINL